MNAQFTVNIAANTNLSTLIGGATLPASPATGYTINLNCGNLIIDVDYTFITCTFNCCPGSEIFVTSSGSSTDLVLDQCDLLASGSNMWAGIRLGASSTLAANDCVMKDAEYAIEVDGNDCVLDLADNTIQRCYVGVNITYPTTGYSNTTWTAYEGNLIENGGGLIANYTGAPNTVTVGARPYAGIVLERPNYLTHLVGNPTVNTMRQLSNGIILDEAGMIVEGFVFDDITCQAAYGSCSGYNSGVAIHAMGTSSYPVSVLVDGDTYPSNFYNVDYCVLGTVVEEFQFSSDTVIGTLQGIRISNSPDLTGFVYGNVFEDCDKHCVWLNLAGTVDQEMTINDNDMEADHTTAGNGTGVAIQVDNGSLSPGNINNNRIDLNNAEEGILLTNDAEYWKIYDNSIQMLNEDRNTSAIRLNDARYNEVTCNFIDNNSGSITPTSRLVGVKTENADNNIVSCNIMEDTRVAFRGQGDCRPLVLGANEFNNTMFRGIETSTGTTTYLGLQDNRNNLWNGTFTNNGAYHGSWTTGEIFECSPGAPETPPTNAYVGAGPWFFAGPDSAEYDCSDYTCGTFFARQGASGTYESDYLLASDTYEAAHYNDGMTYFGRKKLYAKLDVHAGLRASWEGFEDFYASLQNEPIGQFHHIAQLIRTQLGMNGAEKLEWAGLQQDLHELGADCQAKNLEYLNASSEETASTALAELVSLREDYTEAMEARNAFLSTWTTARAEMAANLSQTNAAITTENAFEANEKTVYGIYLTTVAVGISQFTEEQRGTLLELAGQCAYEGGPAVYLARTLCDLMGYGPYNDDDLCIPIEARRNPEAFTVIPTSFQLAPNPVSSMAVLSWDTPMEGDFVVTLTDATGRKAYSEVVPGDNKSHLLNVIGQPSGTYAITVTQNGTVLYRSMLLVQSGK